MRGALAAVLVLLAAGPPAQASAASEGTKVLRDRLASLGRAGVLKVDAYRPLQAVPGARPERRLRRAPAGRVSVAAESLAAAQAYSDARSGVCLAVWQGGFLQYEHCRSGVSPRDLTETFSMNKSVTALMVGAAIADGKIRSVDDPVGRYLPEWRHDARGRITLRQLLSMCSGLRVLMATPDDELGLRLNISAGIEAAALSDPLETEPGTVFAYNNANPQIAGAALRRTLGGESYATYLSRRLWRPLGNGPARLWAESANGAPRFYAGLQASLEDWVRIGLLVLERGRVGSAQVLPASWIDQMTAPSRCNDKYGLGVWRAGTYQPERSYGPAIHATVAQSRPFLDPDLVFFDGFGGQRVYVSRASDLVIARTGEPRQDFDDAVIPNAIIGGLRAPR